MEKWLERRFTLSGRATRREYASTMALFLIFVYALDIFTPEDGLGNTLPATILGIVIVCVAFWVLIAAMVRRLHDIGVSGWWWWLMAAMPLAQIGVVLLLFVGPDKFNRTRFYPDPRKSEAHAF
ncbi:hypothetical protein LMG28688_00767 [Paraburkholderia caffeinitolerans]|uniref:DUF805 domain-containing protein n=1 Tax=Paraburkholderia caffeinitolerans TaxID=1723730 RepID=A0A6J5FGF6_9BURK|nr:MULTISPECIES: DUF805 domain-containing protein [Paraburkholderia]CAB3779219.1 hypothetical protein LMG28688_00767 [Paraburkholderia caffeinitolerans]